jgi:hypothetical protein
MDPWFDSDHIIDFPMDGLRRSSYILPASQCSELAVDGMSPRIGNETREIVDQWVDWLSNDCEDLCRHGECVLGVCECSESYEGDWCTARTVTEATWKGGVLILLALPTILVIVAGIAGWIIGTDSGESNKPRRRL